jgi:hypothetical protein
VRGNAQNRCKIGRKRITMHDRSTSLVSRGLAMIYLTFSNIIQAFSSLPRPHKPHRRASTPQHTTPCRNAPAQPELVGSPPRVSQPHMGFIRGYLPCILTPSAPTHPAPACQGGEWHLNLQLRHKPEHPSPSSSSNHLDVPGCSAPKSER